MEIKDDFGLELRHVIKILGYKTYQLAADDFGISLSYLNQLMRNERKPSFELLKVITEKIKDDHGKLEAKQKFLLNESNRHFSETKKIINDMTAQEFIEIIGQALENQRNVSAAANPKESQKETQTTSSTQVLLTGDAALISEITQLLPRLNTNNLTWLRNTLRRKISTRATIKKPKNT